MTSIVPGYEYDIFISYRQKDNKGDRWMNQDLSFIGEQLFGVIKEAVHKKYTDNSEAYQNNCDLVNVE